MVGIQRCRKRMCQTMDRIGVATRQEEGIISNYYNDHLWSEVPLNGTFINHNSNIAHILRVLSRVSSRVPLDML